MSSLFDTMFVNPFADKVIHDDREPLFTLGIPGWGTFGLLMPRTQFIAQSWALAMILSAINSIASLLIYYGIVKNRGRSGVFIVGYGIIIPLSFWMGYEVIERLDIHNKAIKIIPSMYSTVLACRTMEAMHETSPPAVEASLSNYVLYTSAIVHYVWDEKAQKVIGADVMKVIEVVVDCFKMMAVQTLVLSPLLMCNFRVFDSPVPIDSTEISLNLLHPKHIANSYFMVLAYYCLACVGLKTAAMGENLKGLSTEPVFGSPLFHSTSPSDFWGRRWNLTVHRNLKSGLFLPLRKMGLSAQSAIFFTFAASGLLHDFYTSLVSYQHKRHSIPEEAGFGYVPMHSKMLAFFAYNYALMALERLIGRHIPKCLYNWMPRPLLSTMVIATCLPISHWFTSQWVEAGFYSDQMLGHMLIVKIDD